MFRGAPDSTELVGGSDSISDSYSDDLLGGYSLDSLNYVNSIDYSNDNLGSVSLFSGNVLFDTGSSVTTGETSDGFTYELDADSSDAELMSTEYLYEILDDGTIGITWYTGNDTTVSIPRTVDGYTVTAIEDFVFDRDCCTENIKIPATVTSIDDSAFIDSESIKSITVDENNKNYSSYDGVLYDKKFQELIYCPRLKTSVDIANNVSIIGDFAFSGCVNLKSIDLPDSVVSIGNSAFDFCNSLTSITIPNKVKNIGNSAFEYCMSLTDLYYIGTEEQWNSISFGDNWNYGCQADMIIHYVVTKGSVYTVGNYKYEVTKVSTGSNGTVTLTQVVKKTANVKIPATVKIKGKTYKVTAIADKVFKGNAKIKTLVIGKNVKTIGVSAFAGCTKLKKVTIGKNVTTIGKKAFYNCKKLTKIVINSKKIKTSNVGECAFGKNKKNVTIKVPAAKLKSYKKMLYKRGISKKAKIS